MGVGSKLKKKPLKNHFQWARLRVKGPISAIPREIEISDGEFIFSLPVLVEASARVRRIQMDRHDIQNVSTRSEIGGFYPSNPQKVMETCRNLRLRRGEKSSGFYTKGK